MAHRDRRHRYPGVYRRADGRWEWAVMRDGQRMRGYARTEREASIARAAAVRDAERWLRPDGEWIAVGEYLTHWLAAILPSRQIASSADHEQHIRCHLVPLLGGIRLGRLRPRDIESAFTRLHNARTGGPLTARTLRYILFTLQTALGDAMKAGLLTRNPARLVPAPKMARPEMSTLTADEAVRLRAELADHWLGPIVTLAIATGLRRGEILGLRWEDVDWQNATLRVSRSLRRVGGHWDASPGKTGKARRTVPLPPFAVAALRKTAENCGKLREGASRTETLIFTDELRRPRHGPSVTRAFIQALCRLGLPAIRFHDLRHTTATLLLADGMSLFEVSRLLGHASIKMTADTYGHLVAEGLRPAADRMERMLGGGLHGALRTLPSTLPSPATARRENPPSDAGVGG